jgi:hypothetical protein
MQGGRNARTSLGLSKQYSITNLPESPLATMMPTVLLKLAMAMAVQTHRSWVPRSISVNHSRLQEKAPRSALRTQAPRNVLRTQGEPKSNHLQWHPLRHNGTLVLVFTSLQSFHYEVKSFPLDAPSSMLLSKGKRRQAIWARRKILAI